MRKFGEHAPSKVGDLPIGDIHWVSHIPMIARANSALARFDGMLQSIINPVILLSPLTTQEAVLSSKIEGTVTKLEDVLWFEKSPPRGPNQKKYDDITEVLNYREAMGEAVSALTSKPLNLDLIKSLHKTLLKGARGTDKNPGEFRTVQNYVQSGKYVVYTPPDPEDVPGNLRNWQAYLDGDEKDAIVQLAILKAQFELIHPFSDGNGRIGRMLIPLILYCKKLLSFPVFYMSSYLDENRSHYLNQLERITRNNDWDGWISFFLQGVEETAMVNIKKAQDMINLYNEMKDKIPQLTKSMHSLDLVDSLFSSPVYTVPSLCDKLQMSNASVARIVNRLMKAGIIKIFIKGKGSLPTLYKFAQLLEITERSNSTP